MEHVCAISLEECYCLYHYTCFTRWTQMWWNSNDFRCNFVCNSLFKICSLPWHHFLPLSLACNGNANSAPPPDYVMSACKRLIKWVGGGLTATRPLCVAISLKVKMHECCKLFRSEFHYSKLCFGYKNKTIFTYSPVSLCLRRLDWWNSACMLRMSQF